MPAGILGPGCLIGLSRALAKDDDDYFEFNAFDSASVIHIPAPLLLDILQKDAKLLNNLLLSAIKQDRLDLFSLLVRICGPLQVRLAGTLDRLSMLYGIPEHGRIRIGLKLRQEDLALFLSASRQSINKEIKGLRDLGLILATHTTITILNLSELKKNCTNGCFSA